MLLVTRAAAETKSTSYMTSTGAGALTSAQVTRDSILMPRHTFRFGPMSVFPDRETRDDPVDECVCVSGSRTPVSGPSNRPERAYRSTADGLWASCHTISYALYIRPYAPAAEANATRENMVSKTHIFGHFATFSTTTTT